jgi:hypothetical protein
MKRKEKVMKIFEDYGVLFYLSPRSSVLSRGCIGWINEVQIIEIYPQTESPRKIGQIWVSDLIPESLSGHVWLPA